MDHRVKMVKWLQFSVLAGLIVFFDQMSKWIIIQKISLHDVYPIVPGFLNLVLVYNPGSAFGFLANHHGVFRQIFLLAASVAALCFIVYLYRQTRETYTMLSIGFSLIFGGAIGNMIDRLRFGYVIDFIDFYIDKYHWPAFNIADSAITIGMMIFAFHILFKKMPT